MNRHPPTRRPDSKRSQVSSSGNNPLTTTDLFAGKPQLAHYCSKLPSLKPSHRQFPTNSGNKSKSHPPSGMYHRQQNDYSSRQLICSTVTYSACSSEGFCAYFFVFAWEFCIEKWRGFLVIFFWSLSPTKRSTKSPRKIRGKFGANSGQNSGRKFEKFVRLSFCNFSDLTVTVELMDRRGGGVAHCNYKSLFRKN